VVRFCARGARVVRAFGRATVCEPLRTGCRISSRGGRVRCVSRLLCCIGRIRLLCGALVVPVPRGLRPRPCNHRRYHCCITCVAHTGAHRSLHRSRCSARVVTWARSLTPAPTAIIAAPTARNGGAVREASRPRVRLRSSCRRQLLFMRSFDFPPAVCSIRAQRRRRPSCCPHRCRRQTPASRPHAADDERICAHTRRGDNKQESNGRCSRAPERQRARTRRGRLMSCWLYGYGRTVRPL
jgi:hypothetical protein